MLAMMQTAMQGILGKTEDKSKSGVVRTMPTPDPARAALVSEWQGKIERAKEHWTEDFKRMRADMQLAYAGAEKVWIEAENYVVPIIARHINQAVATLYAKNPKAVAQKKRRVEYSLWDGRADTFKAAMESVAAAMQPPQVDPMTGMPAPPPPVDPQAAAIVQEVMQVQQNDIMLKRVCKTMEILLQHYMGEQSPNFKKQLKQLVRRTKTCGVGYIFLGYQRLLEMKPDISARIEDVSAQIAKIESLSADVQDGEMQEDSARLDELKSMLADLQSQETFIVREGPVFDFPRATEIIIDPKCKHLSTLLGAGWFAREFHLTAEEVQKIYKVDIKNSFTAYKQTRSSGEWVSSDDKKQNDDAGTACVWEVWCKETGQTFTLIDGYSDFVKQPAAPEIRLERFWPLFTLTFNDVEHETELFPLSDVFMLRHTQKEYNRSRQYRRLHREANKPKYITVAGRLSEKDKVKLATHPPHALIELSAMSTGESVEALLQPFKSIPLDPSLYETNTEMEDVYRIVGAQEANLGGASGATATEVSVGEQSRASSTESNVDDLDELLSELVSSTGEMMLLTLDIATVKKIAGPGAEWPQMSREEIVDQVLLDTKAGSSGRPNKAAELANMERGVPYLMQMNGVSMTPIAERYSNLLDIDTDDVIVEGLPSQTALNSMAGKLAAGGGAPQIGTGNPQTDPASQGAAGASNAPSPNANEPGPQPAYPVVNYDAQGKRISA